MNPYYVPFTKEMKKDYTILIPTMLPMHFRMIACILRTYGYKIEILETSGLRSPRPASSTSITTPATRPSWSSAN